MAKTATQLRLEEDTFAKVRAIAAHELRSLNAQIEYFLIKSIEEYEKMHGPVKEMNEYLFGTPEQP